MARYEYECKNCKIVTEEDHPMANFPTQIQCPKCSAPAKKIISHTNFQLKGGGWANDGYDVKSKKAKARVDAQKTNPSGGVTVKQPIIKDRNSGKTIYGPDVD